MCRLFSASEAEMANYQNMVQEAQLKALMEAEIGARSKMDGPKMETRPVPNDEQHRAFQLACRHRDLNDRYATLLDQYEAALDGMDHVLGAVKFADNSGAAMS